MGTQRFGFVITTDGGRDYWATGLWPNDVPSKYYDDIRDELTRIILKKNRRDHTKWKIETTNSVSDHAANVTAASQFFWYFTDIGKRTSEKTDIIVPKYWYRTLGEGNGNPFAAMHKLCETQSFKLFAEKQDGETASASSSDSKTLIDGGEEAQQPPIVPPEIVPLKSAYSEINWKLVDDV